MNCSVSYSIDDVQVRRIEPGDVPTVREIIMQNILAYNLLPDCDNREKLEQFLAQHKNLSDLEDIDGIYTSARGVMYVLARHAKVYGVGAIKNFDENTCEVRRMFLAQEQCGRGYGTRLLIKLLEEAKELGYSHARLEVYNPLLQASAIAFYLKFGFTKREHYKEGGPENKLSMEKKL